MPAFEELGVCPEILRVFEQIEWYLPTTVQDETIPLLLGGGDVLVAAETGSGKTGAFVIPLLQVLYEKVKSTQTSIDSSPKAKKIKQSVQLNLEDRDTVLQIDKTGFQCESNDTKHWAGCRATAGVIKTGRYYYEATVQSPQGVARVGWANASANFNLGTDAFGYGFGATGKKSHAKAFDDYGQSYGHGDVIGCLLDLEQKQMKFTKNGQDFGVAFELTGQSALFPAVAMRNCSVRVSFDEAMMCFKPEDYVALGQAPQNALTSANAMLHETQNRSPMAIIIEPARDLAEQVNDCIGELKKYMTLPPLRSTLCVGGMSLSAQKRQLEKGCEIVVGTPGRIAELVKKNVIGLQNVQFLVLDEADRLIETENVDMIVQLYDQIQPLRKNKDRLQVSFFSATLHSTEIQRLRDRICFYPTLVDLKGQDSVPDTVQHVVVRIDPTDSAWWTSPPANPIPTDKVHEKTNNALDHTSLNLNREDKSYLLKQLKPQILVRLLDSLKMDQCMIFCRTNLDCDLLQSYLVSLGGGSKFKGARESGLENRYSCCVVAGMRQMEERRRALTAFKRGDIRFLICTDVAARGIDIQNLPFVVNLTLPDTVENYIHRIGRVGRKDCLGLAISLVAADGIDEKVWYHKCKQRGKGCWNRKLLENGGCTVWYNEVDLLEQVEKRLGKNISEMSSTLQLPEGIPELSAYGLAMKHNSKASQHIELLQPSVESLSAMETQVQQLWLAACAKFNK